MKNNVIELLNNSLKGKKITHTNTHSRTVTLEVESVKSKHHHVQVTPDTRENDFWGESHDWYSVIITFVDGSTINVCLETELNIED